MRSMNNAFPKSSKEKPICSLSAGHIDNRERGHVNDTANRRCIR